MRAVCHARCVLHATSFICPHGTRMQRVCFAAQLFLGGLDHLHHVGMCHAVPNVTCEACRLTAVPIGATFSANPTAGVTEWLNAFDGQADPDSGRPLNVPSSAAPWVTFALDGEGCAGHRVHQYGRACYQARSA